MYSSTYEVSISSQKLLTVRDALHLEDDVICLEREAVQLLNLEQIPKRGTPLIPGMAPPVLKSKSCVIAPEDRIVDVLENGRRAHASGEDLLKLLFPAKGSQVTLVLGTPTWTVRSLRQLKGDGREQPSERNSIFFLLRAGADSSPIKSTQGYGEERYQVWLSTKSVTDELMKAFNHYDHVFGFVVCHKRFWGIQRIASPPDEALYGRESFWLPEGGDPDRWRFLQGANWRVQWLCECLEPYEALPRFRRDQSNACYLRRKDDGFCLGDSKPDENRGRMKACFAVASGLLKSTRSPHGEKTAEDRNPSRAVEYDRHARRRAVGYPRQNHTAKQAKEKDLCKDKDLPK